MSVIQLHEVSRIYRIGEVETQALARCGSDHRGRRVHGPGRAFGFGQDHHAADDGLPGQAHQRASGAQRAGRLRTECQQAGRPARGTIGFVFQFFALIPGLTAYENVELPLLLTGVKARRAARKSG